MKPRPSAEDQEAWASYLGTVRPLAGRAAPPQPPPPQPPPAPREAVPAPRAAIARARRAGAPLAPLAIGAAPGGLDGGTWGRLRAGRIAPERTLDLHFHTLARARQALETTLREAQAGGLRCLDVITGRGSGEGGGAIRRELPLWLNLPALRPLVLAATHPGGNVGVTRLLLRRPR